VRFDHDARVLAQRFHAAHSTELFDDSGKHLSISDFRLLLAHEPNNQNDQKPEDGWSKREHQDPNWFAFE